MGIQQGQWDTGHYRAVQVGKRRETPAGNRHRLYMRGKSPSARVKRKIPTHRYRVERQLDCAEGLEEEREEFGSYSFR